MKDKNTPEEKLRLKLNARTFSNKTLFLSNMAKVAA